MKRRSLLTATVIIVAACWVGVGAYAAPTPPSTNGGQALEIAPPVINLSANPGQTITTQISLRDISNGRLLVTGQINDFVAAGEDGTPKILLDNQGSSPYSLRGWTSPLSELLLEPKQIKNLRVTIAVPANAAPGGYYGVVRFTATPPELKGTGVSLSASLGALLLLKVNGDVKENLSIAEFSVNHNSTSGPVFESTPLEFVEKIKNSGNIHEQPTGQVTVTDMFGKKVAVVNINMPPANILPSSTRKFTQPLDSSVIGNKVLFGQYHAQLRVTYGANKSIVTSSLTFWVIPYKLIGAGIILLIAAFFALRFLVKRYNRHIISKARKSKK